MARPGHGAPPRDPAVIRPGTRGRAPRRPASAPVRGMRTTSAATLFATPAITFLAALAWASVAWPRRNRRAIISTPGRGAEIPAVDADQEDRDGLEQNRGGVPLVTGDSRFPIASRGSMIATDAEPEQDRHDLLEAARRRGQQQRGARLRRRPRPPEDPLQPGALARELGPRTPHRADAVEHQGHRVGRRSR